MRNFQYLCGKFNQKTKNNMKPIRFLLFATLAAIMCCSLTSCEKSLTKCEITVVNTTQNYGLQIYWDGKPLYSENTRLFPGESYSEDVIEGLTNYWNINTPVDIKIEWYKMTGSQSFNKQADHHFTIIGRKFVYGKRYKITAREKDFSINLIQ